MRLPLFLALFGLAVVGCEKSREQLPPLPSEHGIYVLDKGAKKSEWRSLTTWPNREEGQQRRMLSPDLVFLVYLPNLGEPDANLEDIKFYDWRHWASMPPPTLDATIERVRGQTEMVTVTPKKTLSPGLYSVEYLQVTFGYFGVQTPDVARFWEEVLAQYPDSWQAHNHLGAEYYGQGIDFMRNNDQENAQRMIRKSATHFFRAAEINPDNPEVHNNKALVIWNEATQLKDAGQLEEAMQKFDEAVAEYREAVRIRGDVMAFRRNLADALMQLDRWDEAFEQYDEMIRQHPDLDPSLYERRGRICAKMGRLQEARADFEKALEINPKNESAMKSLEALDAQEANP